MAQLRDVALKHFGARDTLATTYGSLLTKTELVAPVPESTERGNGRAWSSFRPPSWCSIWQRWARKGDTAGAFEIISPHYYFYDERENYYFDIVLCIYPCSLDIFFLSEVDESERLETR